MEGFFEDASSIDYSLTQKYPFYCFINSTDYNVFPMEAHWHYYVELLYATKGHGKVFIDGQALELSKGDLIFVLPRDVHSINTIGDDAFEYLVIKFDPDFLFDSKREAFVFKYLLQLISPIAAHHKHLKSDQMDPDYEKLFPKMIELFNHKPGKFQWLFKSHLLQICYDFSMHLEKANITLLGDSIINEDFSHILPSIEYIQDHYHENINAKVVAMHCHLSYSYFSRQFKKITGITFTQYLNFIRITEAEKLLLEKQNSVTSIGYKVGFTDTSYFIKQFKIFKKMTPKKFVTLVKDNF